MDDRFLVLTTTTEQPYADRACAVLEEAGIPVLLEHIRIEEDEFDASGYRVLVPEQFTQRALNLIGGYVEH